MRSDTHLRHVVTSMLGKWWWAFPVGKDGSVVGARIADADPPGMFERSALSHIRTWKYNPPMHDGKIVQVDDIYVRLIFEPDR